MYFLLLLIHSLFCSRSYGLLIRSKFNSFAAYAEDDCITLLIVVDFLRGLISNNPEPKASSVAQLIQQVVVGADYSEGKFNDDLKRFFNRERLVFFHIL